MGVPEIRKKLNDSSRLTYQTNPFAFANGYEKYVRIFLERKEGIIMDDNSFFV